MSASSNAAIWRRTITEHGGVATAWCVFSIIILVALQLCWPTPAVAQTEAQVEVFTVREVAVDARARTASEARTQGLQRGQIDALNQLFRRLVPRSFHGELPQLAPRDVIDLVQDFSVANERASAVRYLAD